MNKVPHRKVIKHLDANLVAVVSKRREEIKNDFLNFIGRQNEFIKLHRHKQEKDKDGNPTVYANIGVDLKVVVRKFEYHFAEMLEEMSFHE